VTEIDTSSEEERIPRTMALFTLFRPRIQHECEDLHHLRVQCARCGGLLTSIYSCIPVEIQI